MAQKVKNPWSRGNVIDSWGFEGCTAVMFKGHAGITLDTAINSQHI
jgi:hypothetical protein